MPDTGRWSRPTNAPHGGTTTLVGGGSASDEFTFTTDVLPVVQNMTAATIYVSAGTGAASAATQGDLALAPGQEWVGEDAVAWVSIYGAAGVAVNGTTAGGIIIYGVGV